MLTHFGYITLLLGILTATAIGLQGFLFLRASCGASSEAVLERPATLEALHTRWDIWPYGNTLAQSISQRRMVPPLLGKFPPGHNYSTLHAVGGVDCVVARLA
eukprot:5634822-Amphidinium_carterae.1